MSDLLVIRLGLERDDDDGMKTGDQGGGAASCHVAVQFITRLQGERAREECGEWENIIQRLVADVLWFVCSASIVFLLMGVLIGLTPP